MAKCPICRMELEEWNIEGRKSHLIATKTHKDNHIHIHGDLNDKEMMQDLINNSVEEIGIINQKKSFNKKEVVFHNRQRIGDMLVFTCAVRDFKKAYPDTRVNVVATAMHIWDFNPYIDRTLVPTAENTIKIGPSKLTNSSNRIDWHFTNAYRVSIEDALGIHIPQGESRPDIWLTQEEYNSPRLFKDPYWLIVATGEKGWGCKMYPFERWQEFISQNKDILFVQLGARGDNPPKFQGDNVIDYVGKTEGKDTGIRDLYKLFLNAEGSVGLVSFHMHLSGAFPGKPCIVLAGAREPVSFTQYPGHRYLATDNCLPCAVNACWHCDINACVALTENKVPKCVDLITPDDLTRALNLYYKGGRLTKGSVSEKPKFKNVVPTPIFVPVVIVPSQEKVKYGMEFGGGCLTQEDWDFIKNTIKENNVKTVLEFGAGLSTLLLNELPIKTVTYETYDGWIDKIKKLNPNCDVRLWDGKAIDNVEKADLVFVDGPASGANREFSTKIASEVSDLIIVHDATRPDELKWQEKYIKDKFFGPGGGGRRCHFWSRKAGIKIDYRLGSPLLNKEKGMAERTTIAQICENKPLEGSNCPKTNSYTGKFVKFVSTARGWGGCARSITTIMELLSKAGHRVEFIPFRNNIGSGEFKTWVSQHPEITITENYDTLKEKCDVLLVYADDYVWEFGQPEIVEAFTGLNADKKIMMLNYRRGDVGKIPWTKGWDKYMFLNSTQEKELLKLEPNAITKVMPPCTDLSPFFDVTVNYNNNLRIVRHSSQGDTKYPKTFEQEVDKVLERPDAEVFLMPGPSFLKDKERLRKHQRNIPSIPEFLAQGNLFWYSLPEGYMDMGPRVILEALASGLPVIADNWGGAVDRVTPDCGWLCDTKEQAQEIIKNVTFEELKAKGEAARERAKKEFVPENWITEITA